MKIFYHADADGKCSAFIVKYYANIDMNTNLEFIEMDYDKRFPIELVSKDEPVYIVDFSIKPDEMRNLLTITENVTWIDHHITAIEKYKDFERKIRGVRIDGIAGCMLTYIYLRYMTRGGNGDISEFKYTMVDNFIPSCVDFISQWYLHKFKDEKRARCFMLGFNARDFSPSSREWYKFLEFNGNGIIDELIHEGEIMLKYRDSWAKTYMDKFGYETIFEGKKCLAINLGYCNSDFFKSIDREKYDVVITHAFNGKINIVRMYSVKADVSQIAKKYSGGGHIHAAGFQCENLPFEKLRTVNK